MAETGWQSLTFINGEQSDSLPVTDRAVQYGDGLFETCRWNGQSLLMIDAHLRRLRLGCQRLQIPLDFAWLDTLIEQFLDEIRRTDGGPACGSAIVKLIVSRGSGGRGYTPPKSAEPNVILQLHPLPAELSRLAREGIAVVQSSIPVSSNPLLAGLKHLNRLDSVLASQELATLREQQSFSSEPSEALLCNTQGEFIEGSRSNLFVVSSDRLITPPLNESGVAGVIRGFLLDSCEQLGLDCLSARVSPETMRSATEAFICNSVIGIQPIHTLYLQPGKHASTFDCLTFTQRSLTTRCQTLIGDYCGING